MNFTRREFLRMGGGALAGASLLGLAGCGGGESRSSGPIRISVMGTDEQRKNYYGNLTETFQQESGREVKPVYVAWEQGQQKLTTQVGGGDPPDASYLAGRWLPEFADMGALATVGSVVGGDFVESAVEGGKFDGDLYGMPWGFSTRVLFYRADLFEQAGLNPPGSWEEMLSAARELNDPSNDLYGFGIAGLDDSATAAQFMIWVWAAGGQIIENNEAVFDSPKAVKALESYVGLAGEKLTEPGVITNGEGDLHNLFRQGQLAMVITGPWMRSLMQEEKSPVQMDENAAVMPLPPWERQATIATVDTLSVFSEGATEGAKEFLEFAGQDEWVFKYFQFSGQQPVVNSVYDRPELQDDPYWNDAFRPSVEFAFPYPNVVAWAEVESALISAVQQALKGTSPEEALSAAAEQANAALQGS